MFKAAEATAAPAQQAQPPSGEFKGRSRRSEEIVGLRTRTSRTFQNDFGALETEIFSGSIHYRESGGGWKPIDNSIVASDSPGFAFENRANRYSLKLPPNANAPVRVTLGDHWVNYALAGARAAGSASGRSASYQGALPGVDVRFTALNDAAKEELVLQSVTATREFTWRLQTSPGLRAEQDGAGVRFVDAAGDEVFEMPPPVIYDARGLDQGLAPQHKLQLATVGGAQQLRLQIDDAWLDDPQRQFPVTVDPEVAIGKRDCYIVNQDKAGQVACGGTTLRVGYTTGTTNYKKRSLLYFDVGEGTAGFPDNAEVLNAQLALYQTAASTTASVDVAARRLTRDFTTSATWSSAGSAAWTTPGGDYDSASGYVTPNVGNATGWKYWYPTDLVKNWISKGSDWNDGIILKQKDENVNQDLQFASMDYTDPAKRPKLTVTWDYGGMGELSTYKLEEERLTEDTHQHVNVAGGNLMLHHTDFKIRGTGLDFVMDRYYNSLVQTQFLPTDSPLGEGWSLGEGGDIGLKLFYDNGPGSSPVRGAAFFGPSGYRVRFTYDPATGKFERPAGLNATLTYAPAPTEQYTLKFHDDEERYVFDKQGSILRHSDRNGNAITYSYVSGTSKVDYLTDTQGRVVDFQYHSDGPLAAIQDSSGRRHTFSYEARTEQQSNGTTRTFYLLRTYTDGGNPSDATDDETWTYEYDVLKRLTRAVDPKGNETRYTYASETDEQKKRFLASFKRVLDPSTQAGHTTTFAYKTSDTTTCPERDDVKVADMQLATEVDGPRTNVSDVTTYCYNELSRVRLIKDAFGNKTYLSYTSDAQVSSYIDAKGVAFGMEYDQGTGNLMGTTSPKDDPTASTSGAATNVKYGDNRHPHFPTQITDADRHVSVYEYDDPGNLTRAAMGSDAANPIVDYRYEYNYDEGRKGTLKRIEAPPVEADAAAQGNDTTFEYDARGNLTRMVPPGPMGPTTYEYDALSRMTAMTDGKGHRTEYSYDGHDRVTQVRYGVGSGAPSSVTFVYDKNGNVLQRVDEGLGGTSASTYQYNPKNEMTQEVTPHGTTTYDWNAAGNIDLLTGPNSKRNYVYDRVNNLIELVLDPGALTPKKITFGYNENRKRNQIDFPNGMRVNIWYYDSGRIKSIVGKEPDAAGALVTFRELKYDYRDAGGADRGSVQKIENLQNGKVTTFTYDGAGRLTDEETRTGSGALDRFFRYSYDARGNRTCENDDGTVTRYAFNDANQLSTSYPASSCTGSSTGSSSTYSYDRAGNLLGIDTPSADDWSFAYDVRDHTTRIDAPAKDAAELDYEGPTQEERGRKSTTDALGVTTTTEYHYDLLGLQSEKKGLTTTEYIRDNEGQVLGFEQGATRRFYVKDALGSVIDVLGGNDVINSYTYEPYGEIWWQQDNSVANPWRFAQGYFDTETGLYKMGVRYYDENMGRFTQLDPVFGKPTDPLTLNRYQYAGCDPVNNVDPTGRSHGGMHYADATYDTLEFAAGCIPGAEAGAFLGSFTPFPVAGPIVGAVAGCLAGGFSAQFLGVGLFDEFPI